MPEPRYAIGDLADLAGVSRRTVRYYVQEGLLPTPFGVGRGDHYGPEHLERLRGIKALQEAGKTLAEIKAELAGRPAATVVRVTSPIVRSLWRRIELAPGVELQVADEVRMPAAPRLHELTEWCRQHFVRGRDRSEDDNA